MPDLSLSASHEYWKNYSDPMIYRVLVLMESIEIPSQEGNPLFELLFAELGKALDQLEKVNFTKLNQQETFITLGNHLKMTQTLRLLQAIDTAQPGSAARLLMHAEKMKSNSQNEAGLFLKRNIVFERLRLLARIFSETRLKLVRQALTANE